MTSDMATGSAEPITHEYRLACPPGHAFAVYTERIGEWWDGRYTANADTLEGVTIEPWVGGRIYVTHSDLGRHDWGEVTVWETGRTFAHSFTLAQDPQHPSEVRLEFQGPSEDATVVRLAHGGWTAENVSVRHKFGDWSVLLDAFAALAEGTVTRGAGRST